MSKICDSCNSKDTRYIRTSFNIYMQKLIYYKCNECGSNIIVTKIKGRKVNIIDKLLNEDEKPKQSEGK